ncbi:MAG: alpha-amylase family glycosyl hydrolase [Verrucomicrobiota bacterium]|nr:alpha-amylase family glycosyl hydrolase [Verrucomicrobiota bacterium]
MQAQVRTWSTNRFLEDVYTLESPDRLLFGNRHLELEFVRTNGAWASCRTKSPVLLAFSSDIPAQSFDCRINGQWIMERAVYTGHTISIDKYRDGVTLALRYGISATGSGTFTHVVESHHTLYPGEYRIDRMARLLRLETQPGLPEEKFEGFSFTIPNIDLGEGDRLVDVPGPFDPRNFVPAATPLYKLSGRTITFHSAPDTGFGILALSNPAKELTLATWIDTGGEVSYTPSLKADTNTINFRHFISRTYRLLPNQAVESDHQRIEFAPRLTEALAEYRAMVQQTMPQLPDKPEWVNELILLEVMPAYYTNGFKGLANRLEFYRDVGFNAIYLMPHWEGGYSPLDLYKVQAQLGTEADLRTMVDKAHALGMRVLFDMVIHGFNEKSPILKSRPDLFMREENGTFIRHPTWRSVTTDWASTIYQNYMKDLVRNDLQKYGIDGYRVDAAAFKGPNWSRHLHYPAYRSGSAAPDLLMGMLSTMRETNAQAIFLSEIFGPLYYTVCDLVHDNMTHAGQLFLELYDSGEVTAEHYKLHIANVLDALPAGSQRVYFARNHDTSWFYRFKGYTRRFMALDAIHVFFGTPEFFAGDPKNGPHPDEDPAVYNYYRKLFSFRKRYPEFARGSIELRNVISSNPNVFTGIRSSAERSVLVAISLSSQEEIVRISGVNSTETELVFEDPLDRKKTVAPLSSQGIELKLKPFQVLIAPF